MIPLALTPCSIALQVLYDTIQISRAHERQDKEKWMQTYQTWSFCRCDTSKMLHPAEPSWRHFEASISVPSLSLGTCHDCDLNWSWAASGARGPKRESWNKLKRTCTAACSFSASYLIARKQGSTKWQDSSTKVLPGLATSFALVESMD